jgi:Putative peptidoglycan binding domain
VNRERILARANALRTNRMEAARLPNAQIARANARIGARTNLAATRGRNLTLGRNAAFNRAANAQIVNNWLSDRFRNATYTAFYNYAPQWHDRAWWTSNYSRVLFVLGRWWYWHAGYWYPALGYDPYAWYPYDGPIYTGYADLTPDRVIVEVQTALRQDGYYAGPVDGRLGPRTRAALAAFQADHGLAVTSAIDRPTLQTLGLT